MIHLEHPSLDTWEARRTWFESICAEMQGEGAYLLSEQACALAAEVQSVFCAGSWAAVIIVSVAVVEAQLRECEMPSSQGTAAGLIDAVGADPELHRLRRRRNALVHVDADNPALTVAQQWGDRTALEQEARDAVRLMFGALFLSPSV